MISGVIKDTKMPVLFKPLVRELRGTRKQTMNKVHIVPEARIPLPCEKVFEGQERVQTPWVNLPIELLVVIIQRVEASATSWPSRKDVVACAGVCRSWRDVVGEVVRTPEQCGLITFPFSLKQPGPMEHPIQCFFKRDRFLSTYRLYLGLSTALSGDDCKLLLVARKIRRPTCIDFTISLAADDFSRASSNYVGKLRSNFLGTKFTIYDSQPRDDAPQQISPRVVAEDHAIASISYELSVLRARGPRKMHCIMHFINATALQEGATPTHKAFRKYLDDQPDHLLVSEKQVHHTVLGSNDSHLEVRRTFTKSEDQLILKNKAPRWHEQLQCWCLNFKGRVTVSSVKNFQLVAAMEPFHDVPALEQEKVILQFGKIAKDVFTMDYRYPLSAFQAFAISLSSFDTIAVCD